MRNNIGFFTAYFIIGFLAFLSEYGILKRIFNQTISLSSALSAHLVITSLLLLWSYLNKNSIRDFHFSMLLSVTTAVIGPFGAGGSLLSIVLYCIYIRFTKSFEEFYENLSSDGGAGRNKNINFLAERIIGHIRVIPFLDIISFGAIRQKREVITMITKNFRPDFAPALLLALKDSNNVIRVQSATAIANIEGKFLKRAMELEGSARKSPEDHNIIYSRARHYDDYAYTGLLDKGREQENQDKAIKWYSRYLSFKPEDITAITALGRILLRRGNIVKASELFKENIDKGRFTPEIILWYLECMFRLNNFDELRKLSRIYSDRLIGEDKFPQEVMEAVKLWAEVSTV
ncbi:MAG: hypothetical protein HY279_00910 [Nitrospinae bacterium]|nr:hypothetical protein [Nitrospinota bacterium]